MSMFQRSRQPKWDQEEERQIISPPPLRRFQRTRTSNSIKLSKCSETRYSPMLFLANVEKLENIALVALLGLLLKRKNSLQVETNWDELFAAPETNLIKDKFPSTVDPSKVASISESMKWSIREWIRHHEKFVFFDRKFGDDCIMAYDFFDELVWVPDGSIDSKPTAKNMLSSGKLTNVEKYRLACTYCFEEDVKSLWVLLPEDVIEKECQNRHPFLLYWYYILRKEQIDDRNLFGLMMSSTKNYHSCAIEYLWSKVKPNDRISKVKQIFNGGNCLYMWKILCDLNDSEFNDVIEEKGLHIFEKFAKKSEYGKHMLMIWNRIAEIIDIDSFEDIFKLVVHYHDMDIETRNGLRWELWRNAPNYLKNMAASRNPDEYLSTPYNFPLIVDVLRRVDFQYRVEYWHKNWHRFLIEPCCETSTFEEIMELCFETKTAISTFKKTMIDYEVIKISVRMLLEHKWSTRQDSTVITPRMMWEQKWPSMEDSTITPFRQLQKFLNTCSSDPNVISSLKQQILSRTSTDILLKCVFKSINPEIVKDFDLFLVDAFATNPDLQKFKTEFISSSRCLEIIKSLFPKRLDRLPHIIMLVNLFSPTENELLKMKKNLAEMARRFIIKGTIVAEEINWKTIMWKDFMIWCFNEDQDQIKQFKNSISIDIVFKMAFRKIMGTLAWHDNLKYHDPDPTALSHARRNYIFGHWMKNFTALDSFIDWFFESEKEARRFRKKVAFDCNAGFAKEILGGEWRVMFPNYLKRMSYILELWYKISSDIIV